MKNEILTLLEEHKEEIINEGKALVVSLEDGVCIIEKGLDESPFMIKVERYDSKFPLTINQFLGIEK
ncbi:hypothetical protein [Peribacillus butanolivorans]|uniref:hypothetical protein n=1 Tax=Peribacillus butanolivorans TaxID=421767 RepID=UPI003646B40A